MKDEEWDNMILKVPMADSKQSSTGNTSNSGNRHEIQHSAEGDGGRVLAWCACGMLGQLK